jgi:hypothetical protein
MQVQAKVGSYGQQNDLKYFVVLNGSFTNTHSFHYSIDKRIAELIKIPLDTYQQSTIPYGAYTTHTTDGDRTIFPDYTQTQNFIDDIVNPHLTMAILAS